MSEGPPTAGDGKRFGQPPLSSEELAHDAEQADRIVSDEAVEGEGSDTRMPASESDVAGRQGLLKEERGGEPNSWPGSGSGGTIPPPG